ncbi:MAG: hypothetical protein QG617_492, partial [Campylobacterota bacterium]|nr:hypothetical protein [Campylobacterota bacterium]
MIKSTFVAKLFATLLFIGIYSFIFFITTKDKESRINLLLEQQITTLKRSCNALRDRYNTISKLINHEILDNAQNLELLYNAKFATNEEKTRYRDALYEQIKPHFHHFQEIGIETVLFAFWDNKAFLRVHDPKKFDDTLEKDDSAAYVNSTKEEMKGFDIKNLSYKYTTPLYHKQTYLGVFSIGFSSSSMQKNITKLDHEDT